MPTTPAPAKDRSAVRTLLRLWPYVRPVRGRLFTAAAIAVVASCTGLVIPLVLRGHPEARPTVGFDGARPAPHIVSRGE